MITIVLLIFIGGLIWTVIKIVSQIIDERRCLTDQELKKFYNGNLRKDEDSYRRFIAHLGICEKCQERLHAYNENDDLDEHFIGKEDDQN